MMSGTTEDILLGEYVFKNFSQPSEYAVLFEVIRIDREPLQDSDVEKLNAIFNQFNAWEELLFLIKSLYNDIIEGKEIICPLHEEYRSDKYVIEYHKHDDPFLRDTTGICVIRISVKESLIRTKMKDRVFPLQIEEVIQKIYNVKKWMSLKEIKNLLLS